MNHKQIEYIQRNHRLKSVKEIARALSVSPKAVHAEIQKLSLRPAQAPAAVPPAKPKSPEPRAVSPGAGESLPPVLTGKKLLVLALLPLLVFLLYSRSLNYPFSNWDDLAYIVENPDVRALDAAHLKSFFTRPYVEVYVPLTMVSFAADYQLHHLSPFGYHLTNTGLHALNTALVFLVVCALGLDAWVACAAALVFAVHPAQPESVVWISQRKNVLSHFFFLLSFLAYVFSRRQAGKGVPLYALSFLAFLLACLAKGLMVVTPAVLIAYDYCFGYLKQKDFSRYIPFAAAAGAFGITAFLIVRSGGGAGAYGGSASATVLTLLVIVARYFQLVFLPFRQSVLYSLPVYRSAAEPDVLLSLLVLGAAFGGLFWLWRRDRKLFFWGAWYFIFLLPVVIVPATSFMQDRWLYISLAGPAVLLLHYLRGKLPLKFFAGAAALILLPLAFLNAGRQDVWADPEKLWLATQSVTESRLKHPLINLGMHYLGSGEIEKAIEQFEKVTAGHEDPDAYNGLGVAYAKKQDTAKAEEYFLKALALAPGEPSVHTNLGLMYKGQKRAEEALPHLRKAVELEGRNMRYRNNLCALLLLMGRDEEAEKELLESLKIDPDHAETLHNLGLYYFKHGRPREAREYWGRFLKLYPGHEQSAKVRAKMEEIAK